MLPTLETCPSSFRDPAGYVYREGGIFKRAVTVHGIADYQAFVSSGLYDRLVQEHLLVAHMEEPAPDTEPGVATVLVPDQIPFISYPYEWSFGQLRSAALTTLRIQKLALDHGMTLKDASAFNVQFHGHRPVFIDTLSFEQNDGGPWTAYNQFCRHFLAPLLLISRVSPGFNQYLKANIDGFPLDLTSRLLPRSTYLSFGVLLHIHMHARSQQKHGHKSSQRRTISSTSPSRSQKHTDPKLGFVDSLTGLVADLGPGKFKTEWERYYSQATHYSSLAETSKKDVVRQVLDRVRPKLLYDLGGNVGEYARLATSQGAYCICFDIDPMCVHHNYERSQAESDTHMLPLLMDLANPSPGLGFALAERASMVERSHCDLVLGLALLHHLRITANIPLVRIAEFMSSLCDNLLIEFVPKTDVMTQVLLTNRRDTFLDYSQDTFELVFSKHFPGVVRFPIADSDRTLYLFQRKRS